MKVPKEIASKAEKYEELKKEINKLYEELERRISERTGEKRNGRSERKRNEHFV